jgi:hypothetical protein
MIGKKLSPLLEEIEDTLLDFESEVEMQPQFTENGFRAATKIFASALMDYMWNMQDQEGIPMEIRVDMAEKAGYELKRIVETFTGIDTHKMYV